MHGTIIATLLGIVFILVLALRAIFRRRPAPALDLLPSEIMDAIRQAPVLEQHRAGKAYLGAQVRWHVTFESAITLSPISIRLMLTDQTGSPWVWCDIHKHKYPQVNGLVQHAPFWVSGQISKITSDEIFLKNAVLEFDD